MIPITRIDEYLAVISQDEDATGLPDQAVTRIDTYLSKIAGEAVAELPEPVTRIDRYLASIAGMDVVMYDPITRIDYYLATVAGVYSGELPEPVTRIDHYLYNWAEGGSLPWQTFTGNPLQFNAPKAHTLKSVKVEFSPIQSGSGDPSPDNVRPISGWTGATVWDEHGYDPTAQPMTTLSFGSTVYGGTAEAAEDGTATGTDGTKAFNLKDLSWQRYMPSATNIPVFYSTIAGAKAGATGAECRCEKLKPVNWQNLSARTNATICCHPSLDMVYAALEGVDTEEDFKAAIGDCLYVVPLATPVPFAVTASGQPTALKGINTMWTDGDSLTVEARGESVQLNALQSLNMLLGGRYVNNHGADDLTDEQALNVILGGER